MYCGEAGEVAIKQAVVVSGVIVVSGVQLQIINTKCLSSIVVTRFCTKYKYLRVPTYKKIRLYIIY